MAKSKTFREYGPQTNLIMLKELIMTLKDIIKLLQTIYSIQIQLESQKKQLILFKLFFCSSLVIFYKCINEYHYVLSFVHVFCRVM